MKMQPIYHTVHYDGSNGQFHCHMFDYTFDINEAHRAAQAWNDNIDIEGCERILAKALECHYYVARVEKTYDE